MRFGTHMFNIVTTVFNLFSTFWSASQLSPLRQYAFLGTCPPRNVPDLTNDLAFLLHMLDQYDPLLALRLAIFLCPAGESRLLGEDAERCWSEERLRAMTSVDVEGYSKLQLVALRHLPPALFALDRLHILQLKHIDQARFTAQVVNMTFLR